MSATPLETGHGQLNSLTEVVEGVGLHGGVAGRVRFTRRDGPLAIRRGERVAELGAMGVVDTSLSTTVASGELRVRTVEHMFAALGALGVRTDLEIEIDGPEVPLADGGAAVFFDAITTLGIAPSPPRIAVARDGRIVVRESVYDFARSDRTELEVIVDYDDARLAKHASWHGDAADFRARIATARTFGFARDVEMLMERGLASHVARESVVVVRDDGILFAGAPFEADEPARHKLLDLVGDMVVHGGPPRGRVKANRPGHAATNEAMLAALDAGLLVLI